jgi:ABC-type transport system involved in cytochrome c biogenesis permease subunit
VVVFVLACLSWLGWAREPLRRSAFWLLVLTLAVHTWALFLRMHLQGRPPVTNLYSSAVFIGWGCVALGVIVELIFRMGIGAAVAGMLGFVTGLISHYLAAGTDTMEMMRAVLDTNFWLATHVVVVTLGYTATFFAGAVAVGAVVVIGLRVFVEWLTRATAAPGAKPRPAGSAMGGIDGTLLRVLTQVTYGIICFAVLLSFVGTVLGGIWADQSWGRFWGWDPKENGALLIVIWNALILHARWAGMIKAPGLALLAIGGNMITAFSWFGTNQLGVGLHAYGFNSGLAVGLAITWFIHSAVIALGAAIVWKWRLLSRGTPA